MSFWKVLLHFILKPLTRCYDGIYCEGSKLFINWAYSEWDITCSSCTDWRYLDSVRPWEDECRCEHC